MQRQDVVENVRRPPDQVHKELNAGFIEADVNTASQCHAGSEGPSKSFTHSAKALSTHPKAIAQPLFESRVCSHSHRSSLASLS
mgnify:CR=1 FL=1